MQRLNICILYKNIDKESERIQEKQYVGSEYAYKYAKT